MDPYRDGAALACPQCGAPLLATRDTFTCARGCGEWMPLDWLRDRKVESNLGLVDARTTSNTFCPSCHKRMELRMLAHAPFESCASHGVWLAEPRRQAFHQRLTAMLEGERAVRELAALFETSHGRRELARRLLALEAQMQRLAKKLDDRE